MTPPQVQRVALSAIKPNPDNPRVIRDERFAKLVRSIKEFPEMLELRPIVVNADGVVLGGNMRLRACKEAGLREVPVVYAHTLTPAQEREFVIKDNVGFGDWDWDTLANEWDDEALTDWGLEVPQLNEEAAEAETENPYTFTIKAPVYVPHGERPLTSELCDESNANRLLARIAGSSCSEEEKAFLRLAAMRHLVFSYERIAEWYAHASPEVQALMEESALVIIDFDKAIEHGFVKLSQELTKVFEQGQTE